MPKKLHISDATPAEMVQEIDRADMMIALGIQSALWKKYREKVKKELFSRTKPDEKWTDDELMEELSALHFTNDPA
jgi:hypothetical protein